MLKIKKIATAIFLLSGSSVYAGTMGPVCQATQLTLPCHVHEWAVHGQALYMQMPTTNNFGHSIVTGTDGSFERGASLSGIGVFN